MTLLRVSMLLILISLTLMLVCIVWFSPWTLALFLSVGFLCGAVGLVLFLYYVLSDLRARGAL